jgi:D-alanyl-D-alanine carboxypeptidase
VGYATVAVYLPERDATLVVLANSDVPETHSAGQLAKVVTQIVTPNHPYQLGGAAPDGDARPVGELKTAARSSLPTWHVRIRGCRSG